MPAINPTPSTRTLLVAVAALLALGRVQDRQNRALERSAAG
ncbi:MAG: hypothetical protein ACK5TK_04915 [Betaproteobacteria bacterium]